MLRSIRKAQEEMRVMGIFVSFDTNNFSKTPDFVRSTLNHRLSNSINRPV